MICPQLPKHSAKMQEEHQFDFPILFDEGLKVAKQFRLVHGFPDDLAEVYAGLGAGIPDINGTGEWSLPMPARYIVDSSGLIRDSAINPDYTRRPEPTDTVDLLRLLS